MVRDCLAWQQHFDTSSIQDCTSLYTLTLARHSSDAPEKLIGNEQTKGTEKIDYNCEIVIIEKPGCSIVFSNDPKNQMAKINWKKGQTSEWTPHPKNQMTKITK